MRKTWHAANLRPLWESAVAHKVREGGSKAHLWPWQVVRPLVDDALRVTSPAAVERRVLTLADPEAVGGAGLEGRHAAGALRQSGDRWLGHGADGLFPDAD